jgi:hypothetical protein
MSLFRGETPDLGRGAGQYDFVTETLQSGSATAANYGVIFIADRDYEVLEVREAHSTAGTDAGAVTLTVEKLTGTQAPGAGANCFGTNTINLKGTANTVQSIIATSPVVISAGQRLAIKPTGVLTALVGVQVTIVLRARPF